VTTIPQDPKTVVDLGDPELLRLALLDGAPDDLTGSAVTLLVDMPGEVYAEPEMTAYISRGPEGAEVDWPALGVALLAGALLHLPKPTRALLLIACSIGGGHAVPIRLGAVLSEVGRDGLGPIRSAFDHAAGEWDR
jgi:hypothetical protein